mmetsp:Transcript_93688/g.262090  ORF Transcript_93688/g.262090 Transcript_93688/m.262090 type:complete len:296 (-) Transcript_93688:971-1858(-)
MDGSTTITRRTYGCTGVETRGVSSKTQPLQLIHADACGEADGRPQAHPAAVPEVAHALHGHQRDPRDASHGEDRATRARRQGDQLPERVVCGGAVEHVDRGLHQRHVVDDGGGDAEKGADEHGAVAAERHKKPGIVLEHAGGVEGANCQQHTGEEEETRQVHLVERVDHVALRPLVYDRHSTGRRRANHTDLWSDAGKVLERNGVCDEPEDPKRQQHPEVRRQAGGHLQHGDHEDACDAQEQHGHLAPRHLRRRAFTMADRHDLIFGLCGISPPRDGSGLPPEPRQGQHGDDERR